MTTQEMIAAILAGEADDGLTELYDVVKLRHGRLADATRRALSIGDRVNFNELASKVRGRSGTVTKINRKNVVVKLDALPGELFAPVYSVPPAMIERA